jgi:hypothetical protein
MASKTVAELLDEIRAEFDQVDAATLEVNFLQARINAVFEELDKISERREHGGVEMINEHTQLLRRNARALNESSNDDEDQIMAEAKALLAKATSEGLSDEDTPRLERLLAKVKRVTELKQQLRSALVDLLDETRELKDRTDQSEPKA